LRWAFFLDFIRHVKRLCSIQSRRCGTNKPNELRIFSKCCVACFSEVDLTSPICAAFRGIAQFCSQKSSDRRKNREKSWSLATWRVRTGIGSVDAFTSSFANEAARRVFGSADRCAAGRTRDRAG
jgi:hypothetical protein